MSAGVARRLRDIVGAIDQIEGLLARLSRNELEADPIRRAAFERFVEIVSEASRHVPDLMKMRVAEIPWRNIADIGNHLRHAYSGVDPDILWNLYERGHLTRLRAAALMLVQDLDGHN